MNSHSLHLLIFLWNMSHWRYFTFTRVWKSFALNVFFLRLSEKISSNTKHKYLSTTSMKSKIKQCFHKCSKNFQNLFFKFIWREAKSRKHSTVFVAKYTMNSNKLNYIISESLFSNKPFMAHVYTYTIHHTRKQSLNII